MKFKVGDIVLVKSSAGPAIPHIHVRLLKRIVVKPRKGRNIDWPGYSGWEATPVYQKEIDKLRKEWSIPFKNPEKDLTFVYDRDIIIKRGK
jgi:coproporphyrinogen III oxidase